jgi:hypothetical protein
MNSPAVAAGFIQDLIFEMVEMIVFQLIRQSHLLSQPYYPLAPAELQSGIQPNALRKQMVRPTRGILSILRLCLPVIILLYFPKCCPVAKGACAPSLS